MKHRLKTDNEKIGERVYQSQDYVEVLKDVLDNIHKETHLMSDDDLKYDRGLFVRHIKDLDVVAMQEKNGYEDYHRDIHTLALQTTQLIKYGKILYNNTIYEERVGIDTDDFYRDYTSNAGAKDEEWRKAKRKEYNSKER